MPERKAIKNRTGPELYSVEVYEPMYFKPFNPEKSFEKWAAVEVKDFSIIPDTMETLTVPKGQYAVFLHKGPAVNAPETYEYIFKTWLPYADLSLDNRPHFAVMGEKYQPKSPDSEETIWIPLK